MSSIKKISLLYLLMATTVVSAQVIFKAEVNKSEIGLREKVQVSFIMNDDDGNFTPPTFNNFEVVSGPLTSHTNKWENGVRSFEKTMAYTLKPKKTGNLMIDYGQLEVNGSTYKSSPINIRVIRKRKKNYIVDEDSLKDKLYLKLDYPDKELFVNDSIVVTYKLYVSKGISVNKWNEIKDIKINNFEAVDITPKKIEVVNEDIDGVNFRSAIIKKLLIKPNKRGKLKITPMKLQVSVGIPSGRAVFNNKNVSDEKIIIISSDKVKVEVN